MKTDLTKSVDFVRRRFGGIVKAFAAMAAIMLTGAAWADAYIIENITWHYEPYGDNSVKIYASETSPAIEPATYSGVVEVPASLGGKVVAAIGSHAFYNCSNITKVKIPTCVVDIHTSAFEGCTSLATLDFTSLEESNLESIGEKAFKGCTALAGNLRLPYALKTIDKYAFQGCSKLSGIVMPSGVTSIGNYAFYQCSKLEQVLLPVQFIGQDADLRANAFSGTASPLTLRYCGTQKLNDRTWSFQIYKKGDDSTYTEFANWKANQPAVSPAPEGGTLVIPSFIKYPNNSEGYQYAINGLGTDALTGLGITGVTFPSYGYFTTIGQYAFYNCKNLTSIAIPNTVTRVDAAAFYGCSVLSSVTIGSGVTTIPARAFEQCTALTEITIPANVENVMLDAFKNCTKLKRAYIESDDLLWSIDESSVFVNNSADFKCVARAVIDGHTWYYSASGTTARVEDFEHTGYLKSVTVPSTLGGRVVTDIGDHAFANDFDIETVTIPSGVTHIGRHAFSDCKSLTYVYLPDTLSVIGQYAFYHCSALRSIALPSSLTAIFDNAFEGCSSAFITSVRIPDSVTTLADDAFLGCSNLKSVILPEGLWKSNIKDKVFAGCSNELSLMWATKYTPAGSTITYTCVMLNETQVQIGDGTGPAIATTTDKDIYLPERVMVRGKERPVTHIARDAFNGCTRIPSVTLRDYVVEIGDRAFRYCAAMKSADLSAAGGLKTIGEQAFYGSGITSIDVPDTVTGVGKEAFAFCTALKTASLGRNVKDYPEGLFRGCSLLSEHAFSIYVKNIGKNAFKGCTSLKKVICPSATLGDGAFADCTDLYYACLPEQFYSSTLATCEVLINRVFTNHKSGMELGFYWNNPPDLRQSVIDGEFWNYTVEDGKAILGTTSVSRLAVTPDRPTGWLTIPATLGGYPVVAVGKYAFEDCTGITGVTFPDTVTTICDGAFYGCTGLASLNLPTGLTQIGDNAFGGCSALTSVEIPSGVAKNKLGYHAFINCTNLKWAYLPKQFATGFDESDVFYNCHADLVCLTRFDDGIQQGYVQKANGVSWYFVLIDLGTKAEIVSATLTGNVIFPTSLGGKTVTSIADNAFAFNEVSGVTLPNTLKTIGDGAFQYCPNLVQVVLPSSVTEIGQCSFEGCTGLKQFTLTGNITKIPERAFFGCTSLFGVYTCDNVKTVDPFAFYQCTKLDSSTINNIIVHATTIGEYAFACPGLTSRTGELFVPDAMTSIASNAFAYSYCSSVSLPESLFGSFDRNAVFYKVPSAMEVMYRFSDGSFARVVDGVTWRYTTSAGYKATIIGTDATAASVTVPAKLGIYTVTAIGNNAFKDKTELKWLTLPDAITSFGKGAFSGCSLLNRTGLTDASNVATIDEGAYSGSGLPVVTLPDSVTSLGKDAFKNSAKLYKASLPKVLYGTANIFSYWFSGCADNLVVTFRGAAEDGSDYMAQVVNGYTWYYKNSASGSGVTITHFIEPAPTGVVTIPSKLGGKTVDTIGAIAFQNYTGITSVVIPSTVKTIERNAFQGCTGLTSVDIPRSVTSIADYAFNGCSNLASASLPDTLNGSINQSLVFQDCAAGISVIYRDKGGRTSVVVGGKTWWYRVVDGGAEIFYADPYASSGDPDYAPGAWHAAVDPAPTGALTIPATLNGYPVTKIGKYAFDSCGEMTAVTIPDTVTEIDEFAFGACDALATVNFGTGLKSIGRAAFNACGSLANLDLPDGLTSIGIDAFNGCTSLPSLVIPDSVNKLDALAFEYCTGLTSVTLPDTLTDIGDRVFYRCESLTDVTLKTQAAVDSFMRVFDRSYVKNVTIAEGVTAIGDQAFCYDRDAVNSTALETITLPETIESIGAYAFRWCTKLKSLTIPRSVTSIGEYAFANCESLKSVAIPAQLTGDSVGEYAFYYCTDLASVTFEEGAKSIGATKMFVACNGITSVVIPDGVVSIAPETFYYCENLATLTIPQSVESINENAFKGAPLATVNVAARDTARVKAMLVASGLEEAFVDGINFVEALPDFWYINFDANGGTASASLYEIAPNTALGELPTATHGEAYDFLGWFTEAEAGSEISSATAATADVTYYAHWALKKRTVTVDTGAGSTPVVVDHGTTIGDVIAKLSDPTRDGYTFMGWVDGEGNPLDPLAPVTADTTIQALWAKNVHVDAYVCLDGLVDTTPLWGDNSFEGAEMLLFPAKVDGYVFMGWSTAPDGEVLTTDYIIVTDGLTLYAQFTLDAWTVTFNPNDGVCDVSEAKVAKGGNTLDSLPAATRVGYVQNGWWTAADGGDRVDEYTVINSDLTAYAHWTPQAEVGGYTYTYKIEDGKVTIYDEVMGMVAVSPFPTGTYEIPSVIGGTPVGKIGLGAFQGLPGLTEVIIPDGVTEIAGGAFGSCPVLATVTLPKSVTTIGEAAFGGCTALTTFNIEYGETARVKEMLIASGLDSAFVNTLVFNEAAKPTHTVSFDPIGGTVDPAVIVVDEGAKIGALLPRPVWVGHSFEGWFTSGGDEVTADTEVVADISCFAVWADLNYYAVTLVPNDGECDKDVIWAYDGSPIGELPVPTRSGFTFDGWWTTYDDSGTKITPDFIVTSDNTIIAHWIEVAADSVVVTFDGNGGTVAEADQTRTLLKDGAVGDLPAATRTGYTQNGWWTAAVGGEPISAATTIPEDKRFYAHWTPNTYEVVFESNGTTLTAITVTYDSAYSTEAFPEPTYAGHTFAGWFTEAEGGVQVYPSDVVKITADQTLYAHWTEKTGYTVQFDVNGVACDTPAFLIRYAGDAVGTLPVVECEGYTFEGWRTERDGGDEVTPTTKVLADVIYYAHWTAKTYTVTFLPNGGSVTPTSKTVTYNSPYGELPEPTRVGNWRFEGWFETAEGGEHITAESNVRKASDHTVTAHWTDTTLGPVKVTFDKNGGLYQNFYDKDVLPGAAVGTLPEPYRPSYNFLGWFTEAEGGEQVTEETIVTAAATYYAHWKSITDVLYKVTFDAQGGVASATEIERGFQELLGVVPTATKDGCVFLGWFTAVTGGEEVTPATYVTDNVTAYAHWADDLAPFYETTVVDGIEWTYRVVGTSVYLYNRGNPVIPVDTKGPLVIPAKINGMKVIGIGDRAFYGCSGITCAVIPDDVNTIGESAFAWCESMQVVQCGKSLSGGSIASGAFRYCTKLNAMEFKGAPPAHAADDIFENAGGIYAIWIYVPKNAKGWDATWKDKLVNKYLYNVGISVGFLDPSHNPSRGAVSASGGTEIGKKYTLKATVKKGFAFAGWYDLGVNDSLMTLVTRAASYAYVVTGESKVFRADFVTEKEDIDSLAIHQGNETTAPDGSIEIDLGAATTSYSEPKFTVKGLPQGLKFDSKTLKIAGKATKPGIYKVTVTATNASQKKATPASTAEFTLTVPNFKDDEIKVDKAYGPFIPGVTLDPVVIAAAKDCKVTGLPTGMKWTAKDIVDTKTKEVITPANSYYGTPTKPGNYTVYFEKTINKVKHTATATFVVDRLRRLDVFVDGGTGLDKATGTGDYAANAKVNLKATTSDKTKLFSYWYDVGTGEMLSRAATYSYVMAETDKKIGAVFTTVTEDAKHLGVSVGGFADYDANKVMTDDHAMWNETTIMQGVYVEWAVEADTVTFATIAVSGLPAGMKFTAKDVVDSKTKKVIIPANTIYGAPTAASKPSRTHAGIIDPSIVKITMTTAGKVKSVYQLDITVKEMETWAVGTFEGAAIDGDGLTSLTVANSGKISGKILYGGLTWTLAGTYFDDYDEASGQYLATITRKSGQTTLTEKLYVFKEVDDAGNVVGGSAMVGEAPDTIAEATQYNWKADPWKTISAKFGGTLGFGKDLDEACPGTVTLTFKKGAGTVAIKGEFGSYKPTASANLTPVSLPDANNVFYAYLQVYFPAAANKGFGGYHIRVPLTWNGTTFVLGFVKP